MYYSLGVSQKRPKHIVEILANALRKMNEPYAKEINGILINMELQPHFLDSQKSLQEFKREYEEVLKTVKEFGLIEK